MRCEWNYTVGDVCSVGDGAHSKVERLSEGVLYITSKNIGKGTLIKLDEAEYISEEAYKKLFPIKSKSTRHPLTGDILIGIIGSFGNSYIYTDNDYFGFSSSIGILRPNKKRIDSKYLYYIINSKKFQAYNKLYNTGSVQGYTNMSTVKSLPIPLQKLSTQKKIAHILSTLDDKIELNRKINKTLEAMAQALFQSWFVDFDPVHAKAGCKSEADLTNAAKTLGISKETLALFPSEFEESEMGMIPKGWEVKALDYIIDFQNGYSFKSKELYDDSSTNSIKVFKMGHIHRGGGFKENGKDTYYTILDQKKMNKYLLKKGDLLIAMTDMKANMALLSHTALMPYDNKYLLNQRVGRLRIKKDIQVGYPFLYIFSNHPNTINDLRSRSNSGVQVNLTTKAILETKVLLPSDILLIGFNSLAEAMFEKIFANNNEIIYLQKTRDTLLPKLLSGELDVSEIKLEKEE